MAAGTVSVGWGDGVVEEIPVADENAWSLAGKTHSYAKPGQYYVWVRGPHGDESVRVLTVSGTTG